METYHTPSSCSQRQKSLINIFLIIFSAEGLPRPTDKPNNLRILLMEYLVVKAATRFSLHTQTKSFIIRVDFYWHFMVVGGVGYQMSEINCDVPFFYLTSLSPERWTLPWWAAGAKWVPGSGLCILFSTRRRSRHAYIHESLSEIVLHLSEFILK